MDNRTERDGYDRQMIPAEIAARIEREGEDYKQIPDQDSEGIDTTDGVTVDNEGLLNNYAIEPEMYYEEPGDRAEIKAAEKAEREAQLKEINQTDESGQLTMEQDRRGRGVGII
ncbi:hypothetical protein IQ266_16975 [filamentous cyanobacterium LEGE 11480]|uniref:Uncharacterized protein n=1 Tax=Romeriopsis navalis LEGE 11480 TaxID=2777977 RepID=A0A928Z464_9CYAN|nr:hypothetical protein [Romeriopsis navalis]MBE9031429.1 hypothetical protein [Romeriopsis navalis LEGE 11480]